MTTPQKASSQHLTRIIEKIRYHKDSASAFIHEAAKNELQVRQCYKETPGVTVEDVIHGNIPETPDIEDFSEMIDGLSEA